MTDESLLDNPIWHSLNSTQRSLNRGAGLAARYPAEVSGFAALERLTPQAFHDLARLVRPGESVSLFTAEPPQVPEQWDVLRSRGIDQMVSDRCEEHAIAPLLELGPDDVSEMLALAVAAAPGPFSKGTIRMGRYFGIRLADGRLVAMAGERMRMTGYSEISAVCTDKAFRGRGYARALVAGVAARIHADGCKAFLHVKTENGAKRLYEALGFCLRRAIHLTVLARSSSENRE